jgi:UDP-N-acetylglucosamine 1-carboxyvinyltransferase
MGAQIEGIGSDTLMIEGRASLGGARHNALPDRIEAGTYAVAAAITRGSIELIAAPSECLGAALETLTAAGVAVEPTDSGIRVSASDGEIVGVDVMTEPYPGFPTDLQAQIMSLMSTASGAAMITESIFENRFMHVPELSRMGANITLHGASAMVRGVKRLAGAPVMATDLRASVSLVLAGLAADGDTVVNRIYHLDRGYERLVEKLAACGAEIERIKA